MDVIINGTYVAGGAHWIFDTTAGNIALLLSLSAALFGAWILE